MTFNIQTVISFFKITFKLGVESREFQNYNDEVFYKLFEKLNMLYFEGKMTEADSIEIKRVIDSTFQIYQDDGEALISDYDHDYKWYTNNKPTKEFYWDRYKEHLLSKDWNHNLVNTLENDTLNNLMNYLGDPNSEEYFDRRGLVMGDVQSGKTSNYIGLICKAADASYKVIILLTGTLESLRRQTQIRVEEGFIGYDVENRVRVGVGTAHSDEDKIPISVTSRMNDFTGNAGDTTSLKFEGSNGTYIFITKKNATTLKKIRTVISRLNTKPPQKQINQTLLIIDDEADNASINTNKMDYDPTIINTEIRNLMNLFTKANYVGFTATPFANVFIDPNSETEMLKEDLFPRDFIYALNPPSNYFGPHKIFKEKSHNTVQIIDDHNDMFPLGHKKDWKGTELFYSLYEAVNAFLIVNVIRDLREGNESTSHRTMLINMSRFINVQENIKEIIEKRLSNIMNAVKYTRNTKSDEHLHNNYIREIKDVYDKHYKSNFTWEEVFDQLYESIKDIQVFKIPFKNKNEKLEYEKYPNGLRTIVIGGLALSRGLTLEGLTISYLYRNTSTFDVLMQMGRWFGYRSKPVDYQDLCRVWMLEATKSYFEEITDSIAELRADFANLVKSNKTPREFGIRVRNESDKLGITAANKMRTSKKYITTYDILGQVLETPFVSAGLDRIEHNEKVINEFVSNYVFYEKDNRQISKNIGVDDIISLIKKLDIHEANLVNYFQKDHLIDVIEKIKYKKFDVFFQSGSGREVTIGSFKIPLVLRQFDFLTKDVLRINGKHVRVGAPGDTKHGLDQSEIDKIKKSSGDTNAAFLIEGRNPLLIIYPLALKINDKKEEGNPDVEEASKISEYIKYIEEKDKIIYAIALGFPKSNEVVDLGKKIYYINERTNWLDLMKRKDDEEDEKV